MPYKNKYCINDLQGRRKNCNLGCQKYRKDGEVFAIYLKSNQLKKNKNFPLGLLTSLTTIPSVHLLLIPGYDVFFPYESPDNSM